MNGKSIFPLALYRIIIQIKLELKYVLKNQGSAFEQQLYGFE